MIFITFSLRDTLSPNYKPSIVVGSSVGLVGISVAIVSSSLVVDAVSTKVVRKKNADKFSNIYIRNINQTTYRSV